MARKLFLALTIGLFAGTAPAQLQQMNLVITPENAALCGHDYSQASAWIWTGEIGSGTGVFLWIKGVKPNALYTVWLRLANGTSPITGAPATPAVPIRGIPRVIRHSGTPSAAGSTAFFYTNPWGNAVAWIPLDFRLSDGVYPFSRYDSSLPDVDIGDTPFTFRVTSHCTDGIQLGLAPATNEPTFDVTINN